MQKLQYYGRSSVLMDGTLLFPLFFLADVSVLVTAVLLSILAVVFVFGTVANSLVFLVFYRRPSLRSLSNRYVISLNHVTVTTLGLKHNKHCLITFYQYFSTVTFLSCLYLLQCFATPVYCLCSYLLKTPFEAQTEM